MKPRFAILTSAAAVMLLALTMSVQAVASRYVYDTVPGDPMKVKMYTLPNGLRVYMSVNKDRPRIQTNIAVRVGSKNDPAETTGLAHYFEHLMFKGTPVFGTSDYAAERPMLDAIEVLFEQYRVTTDSAARASIYHLIDSISYEASKIAIPNEYDKLMNAIGSTGTNAYTGDDMTCYVEDIPANQLDNWARIQAIRFKQPVIRGFHTELETIYEEKNMSLASDGDRVFEALDSILFPHHPYGQQSVLGSQEHLKNPSITNVRRYHDYWYVPNNMAIILSGDFDPDNVVDIVTRYFGDMEPNPELRYLDFTLEEPFSAVETCDVTGTESERVYLAWRFPGAASAEMDMLALVDNIVCNGNAGLLDLNVNQQQLTLGAGSYPYPLADMGAFVMYGRPKEGQTLDDVKDILLSQIELLRRGEFDDALLEAVINNYKLQYQNAYESNDARVNFMVRSFINGQPWADFVNQVARMATVTKQDVVDFANRYLPTDAYAVLYKRQGQPVTMKIAKPQLTPIVMNRDMQSDFLTEIQGSVVEPIEPRFVDYTTDLTFLTAQPDIPVYYKQNVTNDTFSLTYVYDTGSNADRLLSLGSSYLELLGTPTMTAEQVKQAFYAMACDYRIAVRGRRTYIVLSGLSENMGEAMKLMEHVLAEATPDASVYEELAARTIRSRVDAKGSQRSNFSALSSYALYGPEVVAHKLTDDEVLNADPAALVAAVRTLREYPHRIIYYGPLSPDSLIADINAYHYTPEAFTPLPVAPNNFLPKATPETIFYVAPFDSNQIQMYMFSNSGEPYDFTSEPLCNMYNEYFGGNMSSIVFQEMRESRSLAYSAYANYSAGSYIDVPYVYTAFIATQNDKMLDAIGAFLEIINDMPRSQGAFDLAKGSVESNLRSSRTIKDNVAWSYINALDFGLDCDPQRQMFEALPAITLDDVVAYQQQHVKDRTYIYCILGRIEDLDLDSLRAMGRVVILTPEQTFGY